MAQINIALETGFLRGLLSKDGKDDAFAKLLETIINQVLLQAQSSTTARGRSLLPCIGTYCLQGWILRKKRDLTTRIGTITLKVPRHRGGDFGTSMFERYQLSEQALMLAMIEMVINGVSSRKIEQVTEELCGRSFSGLLVSTLCRRPDPILEAFRNRPLSKKYPFLVVDAAYLKVREDGRVRFKGLLMAVEINEEGYRQILGFKLAESESESSWGEFFSELKDRGLNSVDLITSDDHKRLMRAVLRHFQGASWQRCQTVP